MDSRPLLFRFHRGSLEDSMETVTEIGSFEELIMLISDQWEVQPTKISIEPYLYDERINWNTHIVQITIGLSENRVTYPVGYLNRAPNEWVEISMKQGVNCEVH